MSSSGLSIRGDSLYCPLSLSLDTYWYCVNDCHHCYLRRLNHVWGKDLRPLDPDSLRRALVNGLNNKAPKSPLAWALKQKKTIRFGNKTDPFQPPELTHRSSLNALRVLEELKWSVVIQTMCTALMMDYLSTLERMKSYLIVQPIISPGGESDWEVLERKRTTPICARLKHMRYMIGQGIEVACNGEPFIPGYHTVEQFEDMLKRLKAVGVRNYNTYNFHFNDYVAKRLHTIGIDIERIWTYNQDDKWRPILQQLINLAKKHGMILGCPDFVNSGRYVEQTNTCCGIEVPNPTTFNVMTWKRRILIEGVDPERAFEDSWDGVGNKEEGRQVFEGRSDKFYSLSDSGIDLTKPKKKKGLVY